MPDPFLLAHHASERTFSFAGGLSPISIRDQIVRSQLFIRRAIEKDFISPKKPLVVAGGGFAGVAAVLSALNADIPTTLIEKNARILSVQRCCNSRWLDPAEYDWPASHWDCSVLPCRPELAGPPVPWSGGKWASVLVTEWDSAYSNMKLLKGALLTEMLEYELVVARPSTTNPHHAVTVEVKKNGSGEQLDAAACLVCIGFVGEKCQIGKDHLTRGPGFWKPDDICDPHFGIGNSQPEIVISGGGDGALQDYLRITINPSVYGIKDIFTALSLPPLMQAKCRDAFIKANRMCLWGIEKSHDHEPLSWLQEQYQKVVDDLLELQTTKETLEKLIRRPLPRVRLVHSCSHFSSSYPANRFLVQLVATYLLRHHPDRLETLYSHKKLCKLEGIGHQCDGKEKTCGNQRHRYSTCEVEKCGGPDGPHKDVDKEADLVIIRHGLHDIDRLPQPLQELVIAKCRQILPYALFPP